MKILLLGCQGQVGSEIAALMRQQPDIECIPTNRQELDLLDYTNLPSKLARFGDVDWIINAAAYTAVDKAETDSGIADAVNHLAVREIAQFASLRNIRVLHFSTDYVFDGSNHTPYIETNTPNPINVYGKTKLAGEKALQENLKQHFIVRTSWIFSTHGHNFLKTILRLLHNNSSLSVVADQQGIPTAAKELARASLALIRLSIVPGIYHYANEGATSWYEFACYIKECAAKETTLPCREINAIKTIDYSTAAKRPLYSVLNTGKIKAYGITPQPWQFYVDAAVKTLLREKKICHQ